MNRELPSVIIAILLSLFVFNIVPILAIFFPESVAYYTLLLDTWIIVPIFVFALGAITSSIFGVCTYQPVLIGLCYIPTMLFFYDNSLIPFIIVYVVLNFLGNIFGTTFYRKRVFEEL